MDVRIRSFPLEEILGRAPQLGADRDPSTSTGPRPGRRSLEELIDWGLTRIREQGRNAAAFDVFCQARDAGYSEVDCETILEDLVHRFQTTVPKGHTYAAAEARSSLRQAFGHPSREPWVRDGAAAVPFSSIVPESASWVVPDRVPAGMLTILAGAPGGGKSQLTAAWAAKVTADALGSTGSDVVMLSAEDSPAVTMRPRLESAGANLDRVHLLEMHRNGETAWTTIPNDLPEIERIIGVKKAPLLTIDPLNAFFPDGVDPHKDVSVRRVLGPLSSLANRTGAAIVLVMHLTKSATGGDPINRILGSIGYVGQARSVLLLAPDPDDPRGEEGSRRILAHAKCNVAPRAPSLLYEIASTSLPGGISTSRIVEVGVSSRSARDVLEATRKAPRGADKRDAARELLEEELADGDWHAAKPIKDRARALPVSEATLDRARKELGVQDRIVKGFPATHEWRFPVQPRTNGVPLPSARSDRVGDGPEQPRTSSGAAPADTA